MRSSSSSSLLLCLLVVVAALACVGVAASESTSSFQKLAQKVATHATADPACVPRCNAGWTNCCDQCGFFNKQSCLDQCYSQWIVQCTTKCLGSVATPAPIVVAAVPEPEPELADEAPEVEESLAACNCAMLTYCMKAAGSDLGRQANCQDSFGGPGCRCANVQVEKPLLSACNCEMLAYCFKASGSDLGRRANCEDSFGGPGCRCANCNCPMLNYCLKSAGNDLGRQANCQDSFGGELCQC